MCSSPSARADAAARSVAIDAIARSLGFIVCLLCCCLREWWALPTPKTVIPAKAGTHGAASPSSTSRPRAFAQVSRRGTVDPGFCRGDGDERTEHMIAALVIVGAAA